MNGLGRRPDGENRDEPEGAATGGSAGASEEQRVEGGGCGEPGGGELPAGEAVVEAVSGGRGPRAEASQCGTGERASQAGEVSSAGAGAGAGEVRGRRGRAVWADAGGRALGERRRDADRMRRRCGGGCWRKGCGAGGASGNRIGSGGSDGGTLGSWCRWTEVFTTGWRSEVRAAA